MSRTPASERLANPTPAAFPSLSLSRIIKCRIPVSSLTLSFDGTRSVPHPITCRISVLTSLLHPNSVQTSSGRSLVPDVLVRRPRYSLVSSPVSPGQAYLPANSFSSPSVFRTNHEDVNINETSSYVDLAPLYGVNEEEQKKVRTFTGRGTLHPDVFSENRLLSLPPAVSVLLVLFSRNHNVCVPPCRHCTLSNLIRFSSHLVHCSETLGDQRTQHVARPGYHRPRRRPRCNHRQAGQ